MDVSQASGITTAENIDKLTFILEQTNLHTREKSDAQLATDNLENLPDKKLKEIEKTLNNEAASLNFDLSFQVHKKSGKVLVKIIDKHSHKVIKEIPPESFLDFLSKFEETLGILFDKKT